MNLLVTGGAGFIGANLVQQLLGDGGPLGALLTSVVTLDKLTYAGNLANLAPVATDPRHSLVPGDICNTPLVSELLAAHDVDAVLHLAAESHVDRSIDNPEEFITTNVVGTFRLLEAFRRHLRKSGRDRSADFGRPLAAGGTGLFLQVSTDEVFGSLAPDAAPFSEASNYSPNSPYSASKAGADHLARAYFHTYGLPVVTTNCSNNYGPYQFPEKLLPLMIRKALRGEPLPVYGDGGNVRDWLYVGDHTRALELAAWAGRPGETYLLGGRCELTNLEVVRALLETVADLAPERLAGPPEELITFVSDRPGHDRRYAINPAKAEAHLGWVPHEDFRSGLRKTVAWYLEHEFWANRIEGARYRGERLGAMA
jgi:dTDP-glucose 4,6-dehydratase